DLGGADLRELHLALLGAGAGGGAVGGGHGGERRDGDQDQEISHANVGSSRPGNRSGSPSDTRSGNFADRFSRNAVTPSTASADCPRAKMPREPARWAAIGWSAPAIVRCSPRAVP